MEPPRARQVSVTCSCKLAGWFCAAAACCCDLSPHRTAGGLQAPATAPAHRPPRTHAPLSSSCAPLPHLQASPSREAGFDTTLILRKMRQMEEETRTEYRPRAAYLNVSATRSGAVRMQKHPRSLQQEADMVSHMS